MFESISKKVISDKDLKTIRKKHAEQKIVFCTGCFDILQSGHAVFFNQCKELGDILIVGVGRDDIIGRLKGPGRPVNPENNRVHLVAALEDVNYAVLNDRELTEGKIDFGKILDNLKPDIFVLNEDDSDVESKKVLCDRNNIKLEFVKRIVPSVLDPTSTSRIIDKINAAFRAPLRIDFAGGWNDIPFLMDGKPGYVSNIAIKPLIEYKNGRFNFSGYPRGSGLSTSTAAKLLEMISARNYNVDSRTLQQIAEDLYNLENQELNWAIGRQDQYSIVFGGFHLFEFGRDSAEIKDVQVTREQLEEFKKGLLLVHTGASRNAQQAVEEVYHNFNTPDGRKSLEKLSQLAKDFAGALAKSDFVTCAEIMGANFKAQKKLAAASSNEYLDTMYQFARKNGAYGGKICGAGGGGAFIFYCSDPEKLRVALKKEFVDCFEIDFDFEYNDIKALNPSI